jgi:hypothetical protein
MAEEGATSKLADEEKVEDTMERGKAAHKSDDNTDTPARAKVTPNEKQNRECKQDTNKKSRGEIKKGVKDYFGKGKRVTAPSTEGNPVTTVVQRRENRGAKSSRAERASNDEGQNKKPRSDDEDSGGEESKKVNRGSEGKEEQGGFAVDLKSMGAPLKKKSTKEKQSKKKAAKDTKEEKKKKASFQLQEETQETEGKKDEEEVAICFKCVVGFAI